MKPLQRLEARNVSKTFGSARVLSGVALDVAPGEIHALIGQNGSGKSTLVKILTGYHAPDPGATLAVDGPPLGLPVHWQEATRRGLAVVHQDLGLLDQLSVAENICVGGYLRRPISRRIDWRQQDLIARSLLARLDVDLDPRRSLEGLTAAQRACVAIARALRSQQEGSGLIILDEASRALPKADLDRFHAMLREVASSGTSVLLISHNLDEVRALSHRVTILRDGQAVATGVETTSLSDMEIARLMLGQELALARRRSVGARSEDRALVVEDLQGEDLGPLNFSVSAGEILGITGLPGSGYEQIPYLLGGSSRARSGRIATKRGSVEVPRASVRDLLMIGAVLIPERRERDGLAFDLSVRDNIALPSLQAHGRWWHVGRQWQELMAKQFVQLLAIKAPSTTALVKQLSGGNQQKVLLAKWLGTEPVAFIFHEATQAVDLGARQDILRSIQSAADEGAAVVYVSAEPSDLALISDRVLIWRDGGLRELKSFTAEAILEAVYSETQTIVGAQ